MEIHLTNATTGETRILRTQKSQKELRKTASLLSFKDSKNYKLALKRDNGLVDCFFCFELKSKKDFEEFYHCYRFLFMLLTVNK